MYHETQEECCPLCHAVKLEITQSEQYSHNDGFRIASRLERATEGRDSGCLNGKIPELKSPVTCMEKRHAVQKLGTLTYALCQHIF